MNDIGAWTDGSDSLRQSLLQRAIDEPRQAFAARLDRTVNGPNAQNAVTFDYRDGDRYHYSIGAQSFRHNPDNTLAKANLDTRVQIVAQGPGAFAYEVVPTTVDGRPGFDYRFSRGGIQGGPIGAVVGSSYDLADLGLSVAFQGPRELAADRVSRLAGYGAIDSLYETGRAAVGVWNDPAGAARSLGSGALYALDLRNSPAIARSMTHGVLESGRDIGRAYEQGRLVDHLSYGVGRMGPDLTIGAVSGGGGLTIGATRRGAVGVVGNAAEAKALRLEAAANIWQARRILAETRPELAVAERNSIIKSFDLQSFRVETLSARTSEFRYFDVLDAGLPGRWSTPQWVANPADRIRLFALPKNHATRAATATLEPGTIVFRGDVAPQLGYGSNLTGGGLQTYNAAGPRASFRELP